MKACKASFPGEALTALRIAYEHKIEIIPTVSVPHHFHRGIDVEMKYPEGGASLSTTNSSGGSQPRFFGGKSIAVARAQLNKLSTIVDGIMGDSPSRSSFQEDGDSDSGSYIGQIFEEPMDYTNMPKVPSNASATKRRNTKDSKFHILVSNMKNAGQMHEGWVGVNEMESMRVHRGTPLRQDVFKEKLMEIEAAFIASKPDVVNILRDMLLQNPSIIGNDQVDPFIAALFEERLALRYANENFLSALKVTPSAGADDGLPKLGLLCKEGVFSV